VSVPILATKLYIPSPPPKMVPRPRLIERLNGGLQQRLTLISAPAGFGKTTLVSEWATVCGQPLAWLSLDSGDDDPARFLAYFVAALQTIAPKVGTGVLGALQSPQPPSIEAILTTLLNEITTTPDHFILVLDDYHTIDAKPIDSALAFLLEHLPPQMHLVIATREDPQLPLARWRARGQLTELRAADLRFTPSEAVEFLNRVMGLKLTAEDIAALETRTEGWIAGLQLAALALQGVAEERTISAREQKDAAGFIQSFTGSHRFVLDYLVEEVLNQQPEIVQTFLLRTSILERLCAPLCDAVVDPSKSWNLSSLSTAVPKQPTREVDQRANHLTLNRSKEILESLERANLFIVPLDSERRWYRYHHLFADLLQQRLRQSLATSSEDAQGRINELHIRASQWYEDHDLAMEAFLHAAAANDIERAIRFIAGDRIPQHFRGTVTAILAWLESLPKSALDARPWLWWRFASLLLVNGQSTGVEEKLQAAESALGASTDLQEGEPNSEIRNLIGLIATARAVLALTRYQIDGMLAQSRRALEFLHPKSLISRASACWTMGYAYMLRGERNEARRAFTEAIRISQTSGDVFTAILATIGLGNVQEADNQLYQAAETYRRVLQLAGEQPQQIVYEAQLGLGRIFYEWNDLEVAEQQGQQSLQLARQYDRVIDRFILCQVFLARLKLAQGDVAEAAAILAQADRAVRQNNFVHRLPEVAAAQVLVMLRQGNLAAAAALAQTHELPISQARVHLAQGEISSALAVLGQYRQQVEAKGWQDERLKVMVLQAIAHHALALQEHREKNQAVQLLGEALALAEPGGFTRTFVDEDAPMAQLLLEAAAQGVMPAYISKLLDVFKAEQRKSEESASLSSPQPLIQPELRPAKTMLVEPLSQRELEVLQLIAQGLSNREISERLFLAVDTIKGHNRNIFGKLQVQRRTEAVARARELGLI
jgi:LuxR family maltose regulon positive regulatory protein